MRHRRTRPKARPQSQASTGLACAAWPARLFLTERDAEYDENKPKVKGRIITTISKAKEVRPLVEKCITIACRGLSAEEAADKFGPDAERGSDAWKSWRKSEKWGEWNAAIAPAVAARRRCLQLLGDKQAVRVLFDEVAPRVSPIGRAATRESCGWPSRAWAMRAPARSSNSSACATAWCRTQRPARRSKAKRAEGKARQESSLQPLVE